MVGMSGRSMTNLLGHGTYTEKGDAPQLRGFFAVAPEIHASLQGVLDDGRTIATSRDGGETVAAAAFDLALGGEIAEAVCGGGEAESNMESRARLQRVLDGSTLVSTTCLLGVNRWPPRHCPSFLAVPSLARCGRSMEAGETEKQPWKWTRGSVVVG